ncbi:MAG: AI-2E family transporter [Gemmatimonadota bacterium]|nr:MAG: AI-2E family transporter [Gemmatimonadota bacterium]
MPDSNTAIDSKRILDISVDVAVRLAVIGLMVVWCFKIFTPFILPMMWGIIIAVALAPLFGKLTRLLGGKRGLTATLFTLAAIVLIVIPTFQIGDSVVRSSIRLADRVEQGTLSVPQPNDNVRDWPVVGDRVYEAWEIAAGNLGVALERYQPQLRAVGAWALGRAAGIGGAILTTIIALVVAGFMLTYSEGGEKRARSIAGRVGGHTGENVIGITSATIRSVAQGVLGVALVQAAAAGLGMFIAGIPAFGVWTIIVLVLAVIQLPPFLVLLPVAIWYFTATDNTVIAIIFLVWCLLVSGSDTFLKPMFLGRGLDTPMPVILIGAIGGLMLHGIIGLFVGAVVLAIGYELFKAWMAEEAASEVAA